MLWKQAMNSKSFIFGRIMITFIKKDLRLGYLIFLNDSFPVFS